MVKTIRAFFLSLMILAVLSFSVVGATPVYADDGRQPETPETEPADPAGGGQPLEVSSAGAQTPSVGRSEDDEIPQAPQQSGSNGGGPNVQNAPLPPSPQTESLLERIPENTTITVLDAEGQPLTLAAQESAYAIGSAVDPIWCPAGQPPTPGMNGCTESFPTFDALLTFLDANEDAPAYQQAGTIYIQKDEYSSDETSIDFNNYAFDTLINFSLTLQGGWDITTTVVDPADSTSFDIPIIIGSSANPWAGSLTINNINISNVSGGTGLTLYSQSDISLSNVEVTLSGDGASLNAGGGVTVNDSKFNDNRNGGASITAGGNVSIRNSEFDNNGSTKTDGYGLVINSGSSVTLRQVSASYNEAFGADIRADGVVTIDFGVFSGNVSYAYDCGASAANGGYGLRVVSGNDVLLSEIHADDNFFFGASLQGADVEIFNGTFNNNGSGSVEDPQGSGLQVNSAGDVVLDALQANSNQLFGANVQAVGDVRVSDSFFNGNQGYAWDHGWQYEGYGVQVVTNGNIILDTVTANDNYLFGAHLQGADVEVLDSFFSENDSDWAEHPTGYGLEIVNTGNVSLSNVTANDNQLFGANIQTTGSVTVLDSFFNGNKSYAYTCTGDKLYYGYGIQVVSTQDIFLNNVSAQENHLFGAHLEGADVVIDTGVFSNNGSGTGLDLTGRGLEIVSENTVSLFDVTANNNQLFGADIQAGGNVAIGGNSFFNGHQTYVYDYFTHAILSRSGGYGLRIVTPGRIALDGVATEDNYLYGAHLEGSDVAISRSSFSNNGSGVVTEPTGYGLQIVSTASVALSDVDASNNQLFGADISAVGGVAILRSFFSGHQSVTFTPCLGLTFYGYGLTVETQGDIALNYVIANYNNLWGASLTGNDVAVANSQFNFNVSDSNIFIDDTGLLVNASGDVDLFNVEARENRLIGADITAAGNVYITDSNFSDNRGYTCLYDWCPEGSIVYHGYGLQVTTPGLISVVGTTASNNNLFGAQLNGGVVTVEDSVFNNNGMGNGLTINATDNVTLTNVTAMNNGGNGVEVNGACEMIVQVNGGTFSDNLLYGLKVINAILSLDGTQVFANNGSGNIFTDSSICVVVNP